METTMLVGERFFADKATYLFRKPQRGEIIAFNDPQFHYSTSSAMFLWQNYVWGPSNWTKRVIGIPGDIVRGVIEDDKPVIYLNHKKLDEPYLNKYPLVISFNQDPEVLYERIKKEREKVLLRGDAQFADKKLVNDFMSDNTVQLSYDPSAPLNKQPFYLLKENRLIRDQESGELILHEPETPLIRNPTHDRERREGKSHWNCTDEFYIELGENQYWVMGDNREGSKDCRFIGPLDGRLIHGRIIFRIFSVDSEYNWWIFDLLRHPIEFFKRVRVNRCLQFVH